MSACCPLEGKRVGGADRRGLVGTAVLRQLASEDCEMLTAERDVLDLERQGGISASTRHRHHLNYADEPLRIRRTTSTSLPAKCVRAQIRKAHVAKYARLRVSIPKWV
jgi:hypothetical protein